MRDFAQRALDTARQRGADYADARIVELRTEDLATRNGALERCDRAESVGIGVRVLLRGAWGFACTSDLSTRGVDRAAAEAVAVARASVQCRAERVRLTREAVVVDRWQNPVAIDPFPVPLSRKVGLLLSADRRMRRDRRIVSAGGHLHFRRERRRLATSEGSWIDQTLVRCGGGITAVANDRGDTQTRSHPAPHGGQHVEGGYEVIEALDLAGAADRVRDEAIALCSAKPCPSGTMDLVLGSSQLAIQIHESCGHATELDRVYGTEESYAGRSFLDTRKMGRFTYGSPLVNLIADNTIPGGIATAGYDDDGVRTRRFHLVRDGRFVAYTTNREFAARLRQPHSSGCARADSWARIPLIRIPNLSLAPGDSSPEELIDGVKHGVWMDANRSWSIDALRLNFQFGCETGREIVRGKLGALVKNPTYQGSTPSFWRSCDGIADEAHWYLWGVPNCGKGQPQQIGAMSHGAAPARFRGVKVGVR